jgi:hypothetical protein
MTMRSMLVGAVLGVFAALVACSPAIVPPRPPAVKPTASPSPSPSPTQSPTPAPTPGVVVISSTSLSFTNVGATYAQTVTMSQTHYSGAFQVTTANCSGIATVGSLTDASFTVTPVAAGSCTFTVTGTAGQSATLTIGVTTTSVTGS